MINAIRRHMILLLILAALPVASAQESGATEVRVGPVAIDAGMSIQPVSVDRCEDVMYDLWTDEEATNLMLDMEGNAGRGSPYVVCYEHPNPTGEWVSLLQGQPSWTNLYEDEELVQGRLEPASLPDQYVRILVLRPASGAELLMLGMDPPLPPQRAELRPYAMDVLYAAMDHAMLNETAEVPTDCTTGYNPGAGPNGSTPPISLQECTVHVEVDFENYTTRGHVEIYLQDGTQILLP